MFKVTVQIAGKWKTRSIMWQIWPLLFLNSYSPPPKMDMNLISDRLSTASIKYLNWLSPTFGRFQNGCNKVVIEPRVVQVWSEIILFDFKSRVWFQPKMESTQCNYHYKLTEEGTKSAEILKTQSKQKRRELCKNQTEKRKMLENYRKNQTALRTGRYILI